MANTHVLNLNPLQHPLTTPSYNKQLSRGTYFAEKSFVKVVADSVKNRSLWEMFQKLAKVYCWKGF